MVFHFAREFKQSAGVAPQLSHTEARRASEAMLARTDLSLSEIGSRGFL